MKYNHLNNLLQHHAFTVLLSAEQYRASPTTNNINHAKLGNTLDKLGVTYLETLGVYRGVNESSYLVLVDDINKLYTIELLGLHTYKQESVLIIDNNKALALLKYKDKVEVIGSHLNMVEGNVPREAYTLINGQAWIVE